MFNKRLQELILCLSTAESRYFKQYLTRYSSQNDQSKFARLFDAIRKSKKRLGFSIDGNLQNRLYHYVLESLRAKNAQGGARIQLFQYLIDSEILLKKALFDQAWKRLVKAEHVALNYEEYYLLEDVFEKQEYLLQVRVKRKQNDIELQNINQKRNELALLRDYLFRISEFHKLSYEVFKREGRISRSPTSIEPLIKEGESLFKNLSRFHNSYKAHQICHELARCYMMAGKANKAIRVISILGELYESRNELKSIHTRNYARFLNLQVIILNLLGEFERVKEVLETIRSLEGLATDDKELQLLIFENANFQELEMYIHQGEFQRAVLQVQKVLPDLEPMITKIHNVNVQSKYYRVALAYFGNRQYKEASRWINQNMQYDGIKYRIDIQASLEILNLLNHYELGNYRLLSYLLPSTKKRLQNLNFWGRGEELLFRLLAKLKDGRFYEVEPLVRDFSEQFQNLVLEDPKYGHYPMAYFNLKHWYQPKLRASRELIYR